MLKFCKEISYLDELVSVLWLSVTTNRSLSGGDARSQGSPSLLSLNGY